MAGDIPASNKKQIVRIRAQLGGKQIKRKIVFRWHTFCVGWRIKFTWSRFAFQRIPVSQFQSQSGQHVEVSGL